MAKKTVVAWGHGQPSVLCHASSNALAIMPVCNELHLFSGKSTVAALLERFYDPQHGAILLDGHPLSSLDPSWVRGELAGYIHQEPVLFATSVMENIRYGRPSATDQEVRGNLHF